VYSRASLARYCVCTGPPRSKHCLAEPHGIKASTILGAAPPKRGRQSFLVRQVHMVLPSPFPVGQLFWSVRLGPPCSAHVQPPSRSPTRGYLASLTSNHGEGTAKRGKTADAVSELHLAWERPACFSVGDRSRLRCPAWPCRRCLIGSFRTPVIVALFFPSHVGSLTDPREAGGCEHGQTADADSRPCW
jgi:hypothetical protein